MFELGRLVTSIEQAWFRESQPLIHVCEKIALQELFPSPYTLLVVEPQYSRQRVPILAPYGFGSLHESMQNTETAWALGAPAEENRKAQVAPLIGAALLCNALPRWLSTSPCAQCCFCDAAF